jgi:chromatin remodeling complex protein RSC6
MATSKKSAPAKSAAKKAAPAKSAGTTAAKAPAKGGAAKGGAAKSGRAPNAAFMKPMTPSAELAAVVGSQPQPRSEITKRVWDYIKKNNLQDAQNRRQINADDKLRPVFGGKKNVTMFEMTSLVNKHLKG